ncbi:hypothetical protein WA026_022118 [Henosepilachna vigintioctopunctata]|uniref:GH18 domain-containing protein n=1 Tax=Henosepilachna vigintioctopunctata TaxID=420089 RepID=A0AAW1UF70_9CUCU
MVEIHQNLTLRHVLGPYAFQVPGSDFKGTWISYDNPDYAEAKAIYARNKGLGGMAVNDLSLDDFRGSCAYEKYPILKTVYNLITRPYSSRV